MWCTRSKGLFDPLTPSTASQIQFPKKNGWPWRLPFENQINYPSSNTYWVFGPPWTWSGQGKVKDNDPLAPAAPGLTVVKLWNPRGILYPPTPAVTKEGLGLSQHKSTHHMQSPFRICYILRDMRWNNMYWCMSCTVGGVSISLSFFHGKPVGGCKPAAVTLRLAYWLVVPKKQGNKASSSKWISIAWKWVSLSDKVYENQRFLPWIIYKIPKFCLSNRPPQALTAPGSYSIEVHLLKLDLVWTLIHLTTQGRTYKTSLSRFMNGCPIFCARAQALLCICTRINSWSDSWKKCPVLECNVKSRVQAKVHRTPKKIIACNFNKRETYHKWECFVKNFKKLRKKCNSVMSFQSTKKLAISAHPQQAHAIQSTNLHHYNTLQLQSRWNSNLSTKIWFCS